MRDLRSFTGLNSGYVLERYERFLRDPQSVDPYSRAFFAQWTLPEAVAAPTPVPPEAVPLPDLEKAARAAALADALRREGCLSAHLNPLQDVPARAPGPTPADYGLTDQDLTRLPATVIPESERLEATSAQEAIAALRRIYCGTTGYEVDQVQDAVARTWLRAAIESGRYRVVLDADEQRRLLERLTQVGSFERFLQQAFPGRTRFSLEGTGMLVPVLDAVLQAAADTGVRSAVLGMAHRGRLNVLAHVLGRPYEEVMAEFREVDQDLASGSAETSAGPEAWLGDVRYHLGAHTTYHLRDGTDLSVTLAPNPSHLEYVNPVVEGMVRALQDDRSRAGAPGQQRDRALAVLVHGDAAFPGQGVVAETLNLSRLPGYEAGGTIHIIVNNQLGFTTGPEEGRSTRCASDLARGFGMPIFHVNADDPPACLSAVRLAYQYRQQFHQDVVIDLVGYRRWGHNEGDEPSFTQPLLYQQIAGHPTVRELWARTLDRAGIASAETAETMLRDAIARLQEARRAASTGNTAADVRAATREGAETNVATRESVVETSAGGTMAGEDAVETAVPAETLVALNQALLALPDGFTLHPRLARPWQRRSAALSPEGTVDWAHAETLAFAAIVAGGTPVRLSGQDSARGTFSQRHLVLHDTQTGATYTPLQSFCVLGSRGKSVRGEPACPEVSKGTMDGFSARPSTLLRTNGKSFAVYNSPLSENAVLGFEYGYSVRAPEALVLWEAQYGDFVNGAQVMVDQFITAGRAKWGQRSGLVLLLPHGYEGQGPEHSSARLERFLQSAVQDNLRVANPSTAAQYFHLLRRQAALLRTDPRPLVCLTPKSLLRLPEAAARLEDLAGGTFRTVIDDEKARSKAAAVRRLLLCSGKVYYDLLAGDRERTAPVALVRVEELYPFPEAEVCRILASYPGLQQVVWVQEEPENMGAWHYVERRLRPLVEDRLPLSYLGRPAWTSPAEGSSRRHAGEQARIAAAAFSRTDRMPLRTLGVKYAR